IGAGAAAELELVLARAHGIRAARHIRGAIERHGAPGSVGGLPAAKLRRGEREADGSSRLRMKPATGNLFTFVGRAATRRRTATPRCAARRRSAARRCGAASGITAATRFIATGRLRPATRFIAAGRRPAATGGATGTLVRAAIGTAIDVGTAVAAVRVGIAVTTVDGGDSARGSQREQEQAGEVARQEATKTEHGTRHIQER